VFIDIAFYRPIVPVAQGGVDQQQPGKCPPTSSKSHEQLI